MDDKETIEMLRKRLDDLEQRETDRIQQEKIKAKEQEEANACLIAFAIGLFGL